MGTSIPLDDYAQQAYAAYTTAINDIRDAETRRDKARDTLVAFLDLAEAEGADLDGIPVLALARFDQPRFDVTAFKDAEPFTYRKYVTVRPVTQLRQVRGER